MEIVYAILDGSGGVVDISESETVAMRDAKKIARGRPVNVRVTDTTKDPAYFNPVSAYDTFAQKAAEATRLPYVSESQIMAYTPEQAFNEFRDIWPSGSGRYESVQSLMPGLFKQRLGRREDPQSMFRNNTKMNKRAIDILELPKDYEGIGLSLLPHTLPWRGQDGLVMQPWKGGGRMPNLCLGASKECIKGCLITSGRQIVFGRNWEYEPQKNLEPWQTYPVGLKLKYVQALHKNPAAFIRLMMAAVQAQERASQNMRWYQMFYRLNVFSDIPWELIAPDFFKLLPDVQFYDYTKVPGRQTPQNYHLTFSFSGFNKNFVEKEMQRGRGIATVFMTYPGEGSSEAARQKARQAFKGVKPIEVGKESLYPIDRFWGRPVVSGDQYDLRPLDEYALQNIGKSSRDGYIVWLDYKLPTVLATREDKTLATEFGAFVIDAFYDSSTGTLLAAETPAATGANQEGE